MKIKRHVLLGGFVVLVSVISLFAGRALHKRYLDSKLNPEDIVAAIRKEGFTISATSAMEHCDGPLKCGDRSISVEVCAVNECGFLRIVLYSSHQEARDITSSVNGMNCLLGTRALRRGRLVLDVPCDNALAESVEHVFQNAKPGG